MESADHTEAPASKKARTEATERQELCSVDLAGVTVNAVGLGTLPAGVAYPEPHSRPTAKVFHEMLHAAAAACGPHRLVVDTADTYCHPFSALHALERELALGSAGMARAPVVSTKSGMKRMNDESSGWRPRSTPAGAVRKSIEEAQKALCPTGTPLFLWSLHNADGYAAPGALEDALAEAVTCVKEGLLLHIGLCNATGLLVERALSVTPLLCVQNEWSLFCREAEQQRPPTAAASSKKGMLRICAQRDIVFVAHSPLGGLKARRGERSVATKQPVLGGLAGKHGASPQAVCLAAMLGRAAQLGARVLLIPGARTASHAAESCSAAALRLSDAEIAAVMGPVL